MFSLLVPTPVTVILSGSVPVALGDPVMITVSS